MNSEKKLFGYKIKNNTAQKFTFEISTSRYINFIFIDNTREAETNLNSFLNFNFETYTSYEGISFPIIFKIDSDLKSLVKFNYNKNNYYNSDYLLEYCKINQNQCEYKGINMTAIFEKGGQYKIKYNCYIYSRNSFRFNTFSSISIFELYPYNITSFEVGSNNEKQYYLINIKNNHNFFIYIEKGESYLYTKYMNKTDIEDIDMIINYSYNYERYETRNKLINFNNKANEYLIIRVDYEQFYHSSSNKGILGFMPEYFNLTKDDIFEIEKGKKAIFRFYSWSKEFILVSSNENIKVINSSFDSVCFTKIILDMKGGEYNIFIYVDASKEKTKIKLFDVKFDYHANTKLKLYTNYDLKNYLDKYGPDSLFMRMSSHSSEFLFNVFYIYGFKEKYYLYIKKHYGNIDFYQYNKELNEFSNITKFAKPYDYTNDFDLIKTHLLNISGCQIFSFYNSYNSLIDFYLQKIDDSEYININSNMFLFNNTLKLLNGNKLYYLNFTLDHIIKLDNKFLEAEIAFTDINGIKYFLNKENKVLRNLKGDNITIISTQKALIYFYKRINRSDLIEIEFDKYQKDKIMKFNINKISSKDIAASFNIIRDF